jgi:hypothetical protein
LCGPVYIFGEPPVGVSHPLKSWEAVYVDDKGATFAKYNVDPEQVNVEGATAPLRNLF